METLVGVVLGYVLRGATGSEGFNQVMEQSRALRDSDEFKGLVRAVRNHSRSLLHDLTATLSERAGQVSGLLEPEELPEPPNPWARWGLTPEDRGSR